ncbi:MAG: glycogen/starch/alpha-glucan phosphorylase [Paracoccaceae bacterium]
MTAHTPPAHAALDAAIAWHLAHSVGKTPGSADLADWRVALSRAVRDRLVAPWFEATRRTYEAGAKRVYYLSMEFLLGRMLEDAIGNLGLETQARAAMADFGVDYREVLDDEPDAALGNGGLGRLAACFLDSLSCLGIPAYGYGIRYAHGLFRQRFDHGAQVEDAENWLAQAHPWEFERHEVAFDIGFGGEATDESWRPSDLISARAHDTPVPGWRAHWTNTLRLWSARPKRIFDLEPFNRGDYMAAAAPEVFAETISRVLYPDDSTPVGKELRLKQEYFFTSASLQDILRRFLATGAPLAALPSQVAIQMNDTHPAIAGPELVRLLTDGQGLDFEAALGIAEGCLNYTNHTLLPEALERWPVGLMAHVLPRHLRIIERIDELHASRASTAGRPRPERLRIVEPGGDVKMGELAFITARRVNGVSALHTELMKETVFADLHALHPEKIVNMTNGVTPRRWLHGCNPGLRDLITDAIGPGWVTDLEQLERLEPLADDSEFRSRFRAVKRANKARLVDWLAGAGIEAPVDAMFDIQIKRVHEYKRQLMNILEAAAHANAIRRDPSADWVPRVRIFGGKAAPAYVMAKNIIRLINDIGVQINNDPVIGNRLKIVYPENYNVSMAERLIPAAELSEQISTAGMEASGTGNMKFAMNGALTIGTLDGANVEISEHVGVENIFIFGLTAHEAADIRHGYDSGAYIAASPALSEVVSQIECGFFSPAEPGRHHSILEKLRHDDHFLVAADFEAYREAQRKVDEAWRDEDGWSRMAVLNTARSGWFSSDRTIRSYAKEIWGVSSLS